MTLFFSNHGAIDVRCITTFGLSVKEGLNPIGRFGTGLNNAIAVILRLGGGIKINVYKEGSDYPHTIYNFTTVKETVRGKDFNFVHMESGDTYSGLAETQPLGFTTDLARHWEPWMAYRELRSNVMDEGGYFGPWTHRDHSGTEIIVNCPEIEEAHLHSGDFFLETSPLWASPVLEVHPAREDGAIFYRGIRVAKAPRKSLYTYNILQEMPLTEDRTVDIWYCKSAITRALAKVDNDPIADAILLAKNDTYEADLDFTYTDEFSPTMRKALVLHRHNHEVNQSAQRRSRALYIDDYKPIAIPMTAQDYVKVLQVRELFTAFALPFPFDDIRLCEESENELPYSVYKKTFWITRDAFDSADWLVYILEYQFEGLGWDIYRTERRMLHIMRMARPDLKILEPYDASERQMEPTHEEIQSEINVQAADPVPFDAETIHGSLREFYEGE